MHDLVEDLKQSTLGFHRTSYALYPAVAVGPRLLFPDELYCPGVAVLGLNYALASVAFCLAAAISYSTKSLVSRNPSRMLMPYTGVGQKASARFCECCGQAQAGVVSNSRDKIHQTWPKPFSRAL